MMGPVAIAVWVVGWYGGLGFFAWYWVCMLRSGEAGSSGLRCSRKSEPVRFWLCLIYEGAGLVALAVLPVWILWKLALR
jgi:hypothetical protein